MMHRWIVPVAAVLFLAACIAALVFWESCDVELLARDGVRYAIVKRGSCLDTSVGFWVSDGDGWLSYYLDHEVFRWENYSSRFVGDSLEVRKAGRPFASYDPRTKVFTSLDPKGADVLPGERIWTDGKGSVHLATVKGKDADALVLYPDQELTEVSRGRGASADRKAGRRISARAVIGLFAWQGSSVSPDENVERST